MLDVTALTKEDVQRCPVRQVLSKVTGKWQILIVLALEDGPLRFNVLRRTVGDITQRVLTENLKTLQRDGYLTRTVQDTSPITVEYELTALGQALVAHLKPLVMWANDSFETVAQARGQYDQKAG